MADLFIRGVWLSCVLGLVACTSQPVRIIGGSTAQRAADLTHWQAQGKLGITGVPQSGSGRFTWQQQDADSTVQIQGPLGMGTVQVELSGTELNLRSSDGAHYTLDQAVQELQQRLGVAMPIMQLRYWLLGMAAPGEHQWLQQQQLLQQAEWRIAYAQWLHQGELRLPGRLTLTHEQLRIVVVVQRWQVL